MQSIREQLNDAVRAERAGVLDHALKQYEAIATFAEDPTVTAEAFRRQSDIHRAQCQWERALQAARRSGEIAREYGLAEHYAEALNAQAEILVARGDLGAAEPIFEQMLAATDDARIRGIALQNLGTIAALEGRLDVAEQRFEQSHAHFQEAAYLRGSVIALLNRGAVALRSGDLEFAERLCEAALRGARGVEDQELTAIAMANYAEALLRRQQLTRAEELATAALGIFGLMENSWRRIPCLQLLGDVRAAQGRPDIAGFLFEEALQLANRIGAHAEVAELQGRLTAVRRTGSGPGPA